jgi:hypothetical protein
MTLATRAQMLRAGDKARDALGDRYLITASQMHITGSSRDTGIVQWWVYADGDGCADLDHVEAAQLARETLLAIVAEGNE